AAGAREAGVAGTRLATSATDAAFANAIMAHADETDDSHQPAFFHPGCAVVPAALAMGEREKSSGAALLKAVVLGYDIGCRVNLALGAMRFHLAGHSTHSFGATFGAAAAAGVLAQLDADRMRHLLSYTAQQASGVSCWMRDSGHVEKAFDFGGMPARNGVAAATMVAHGFSGVADVFASERNFLFAYGGVENAHLLVHGLGKIYEILHANIKQWPVGSPIQAALDSVLVLMREHGIRAGEVERMVVRTPDDEAGIVNDSRMPDINMQHLLAVMLLDGTLTFASAHDAARMKDPKVLDVKRRIELVGSADLTRARPPRQCTVEIRVRDGRELRHHTSAVKGTVGNPMTRSEVGEKCLDLTAPVLGGRRARTLIDTMWNLEKLADVRALRALLRA
ncbi:MAG: MmgE/PrpD family protein, partial [Betaproteobacteria bacterium]|nr:MmgE/PrpD family protein [Betaproteobacteria bacterium]